MRTVGFFTALLSLAVAMPCPVAAPAGGRFTLRAERWRIDVSLRPAGADRRLELTITVTRPR